MIFNTDLHVIHEEMVYEEDTDDSDDPGLNSIDDIFPTIQRDRYNTRDSYMEALMKNLSGKGTIVKKWNRSRNGSRYRRLYVMGRYMYLSSFFIS